MAMFPETVEKLGSLHKPQVPGSFVCPTGKGGTRGDKNQPFQVCQEATFKRVLIGPLPWISCSVRCGNGVGLGRLKK